MKIYADFLLNLKNNYLVNVSEVDAKKCASKGQKEVAAAV
jgi:hypothetical protein